jgi:hypothetical protein
VTRVNGACWPILPFFANHCQTIPYSSLLTTDAFATPVCRLYALFSPRHQH